MLSSLVIILTKYRNTVNEEGFHISLSMDFRNKSNKNKKTSSFKSNENIHKKEDGSYYVVSVNKASSMTL